MEWKMPRLIDADKVAEAIAWLEEYDFVIWHDVMECIDKVPTVDAVPLEDYQSMERTVDKLNKALASAVEVVRCKECKKYIPCQKLPIGTSKWCDLFDRATCEMNYCSWGERREDADK